MLACLTDQAALAANSKLVSSLELTLAWQHLAAFRLITFNLRQPAVNASPNFTFKPVSHVLIKQL